MSGEHKTDSSPERTQAGKTRILFWILLAIGVLVRVWNIGQVPGYVNQDEAFAAYQALCLMRDGVDSWGYRLPMYFVAWGSGMNVLESYLMIPFIALLGFKVWVIRLPQLVVGVLSLAVLYLTVARLVDKRAALLSLFLLLICPWHIMLCRWGLESNLAPGFILFGFYFFLRGLEKPGFFFLSACMYGATLYAYATTWMTLPVILILQVAYCIWMGKLRFSLQALLSLILLFLFALPCVLFLLVNAGYMDEVRTQFISIPRMLYFRSSMWAPEDIGYHARLLGQILFLQNDGYPWNYAQGWYGTLYLISIPFGILGLVPTFKGLVSDIRQRALSPHAFLLIHLLAGLGLALMTVVNINRANILFIPLVLLTASGINWLSQLVDSRTSLRPVFWLTTLVYTVSFLCFVPYYFGRYPERIGTDFFEGFDEALVFAQEQAGDEGEIAITNSVTFPVVLFHDQTELGTFQDTVVWANYPNAYLDTAFFDRYVFFGYVGEVMDQDVQAYIAYRGADVMPLIQEGCSFTEFGVFQVAVPSGGQ